MTGQHLNDLLHRTAGMSSKDVAASKLAWEATATALGTIQTALNDGKEALVKGFGERETGSEAMAVFDGAVARINGRQQEMADVATALEHAATAMKSAETAADKAPDAPADTPPAAPPSTGDIADDVTALKQHASEVNAYNHTVTAYGNADEEARKKVARLLERYDEAYTALSKVEGEPVDDDGGGQDDDTDTGGGHVPPVRHGSVPTGTWISDDTGQHVPGVDDPSADPGAAAGAGPAVRPPPISTLDPDLELPDQSGPGGTGLGLSQGAPGVIGGVTAAGVFGAPGLVRGIRGLLSGRGLSGSVGAIGSTTRAGAPGSLGRGGAATPGSPVSRAGGRTGGAGVGRRGGGAGGRGSGGRGGAAAAGTAGRRKRDERDGEDRDLFDDGQEWIDDEGAAPGVLD
ncbi:hypothetical protein [Nocardioides humi]|uniref:PPE family protein n=1 Tax=Nocardioides humi TaxID=449461 RepID=A0ABN1ZRK3_9ACTN|nr:hypothetical protein [Nocardioides humi]